MNPLAHVKPKSVMIGYINGGKVNDVFMQSMNKFRDMDADNLHLFHSYVSARGAFLEDNRNSIIQTAYDHPEVEWLLFIDTDIEFDALMPYQLLYLADTKEHRVITGLYFGKPDQIETWVPIWYRFDEKNEFLIQRQLDGKPLQRIAGAGMGCCLIHRSVFDEFPEVEHNWRWFGRDPWMVNGKIYHLSEDLSFCLRLAGLGLPGYSSNPVKNPIPLWGHRGVVVKHYKEQHVGLNEFLSQTGVIDRVWTSEGETPVATGPRTVVGADDSGHEPGMQAKRVIRLRETPVSI